MGKDVDESRSILRRYHSICLEGLLKITKSLHKIGGFLAETWMTLGKNLVVQQWFYINWQLKGTSIWWMRWSHVRKWGTVWKWSNGHLWWCTCWPGTSRMAVNEARAEELTLEKQWVTAWDLYCIGADHLKWSGNGCLWMTANAAAWYLC